MAGIWNLSPRWPLESHLDLFSATFLIMKMGVTSSLIYKCTPLTQVHKHNSPNPHIKQSCAGLPSLHKESRFLRIFALGAEKRHSTHKPQLYIEIVPSREFPPSRESDLITCLWMCLKQQNSTERHQEGRKMECLSCPTFKVN